MSKKSLNIEQIVYIKKFNSLIPNSISQLSVLLNLTNITYTNIPNSVLVGYIFSCVDCSFLGWHQAILQLVTNILLCSQEPTIGPWAWNIQFISSLILSFQLDIGLTSCLFPSSFLTKGFLYFTSLPCMLHAITKSSPWLHDHNNIWWRKHTHCCPKFFKIHICFNITHSNWNNYYSKY